MRSLRILLVDHAPIVGGVELMIRDLLTGLDPARVAPTVVTDAHSPLRGKFSSIHPEIAIPLAPLKRNPLAAFSLLNAALQLARAARASRADLIQTFTARTHLVGALAAPLARTPLVWRLNDDTLYRPLAAAFGHVPRRIIAVSRHLREHYAGVLRVTDIIPDGVLLLPPTSQAEARRVMNLPMDACLVTLAARLVRWKGHVIFLRALAQLAPDYPQLHGQIVGGWSEAENRSGPLAGGGPYHRELLALTSEVGLTGRVTFTGHTNAIALTFAASDLVAHTSTLPEPFGRVIVEAMAAARPVVAARAGGAPEIVDDGVTGLLTTPGDVDALAAAIRQLLENPQLREQMGVAGRARAEREYSLPLMAERFTQVWTEVSEQ